MPALPTHSSRNLLAFLALNAGRLHQRDLVAGVLWGDRPDSSARKALRNSLWRLKCAIDLGTEDGAQVIHTEGHEIGFVEDAVWIDTREFDALTGLPESSRERILTAEEAERLDRAVALYRGDLLDGLYEDWCLGPRERLRLALLTALERLFLYHRARGDFLSAIDRGCTLVRHDPLREHIHRGLMACHWAMGDRPSALRQFVECESVLGEELGIEPMEETRRLRDAILRGRDPDPEGVVAVPPPRRGASPEGALDGALTDLYAVAGRLERLRAERAEVGPD